MICNNITPRKFPGNILSWYPVENSDADVGPSVAVLDFGLSAMTRNSKLSLGCVLALGFMAVIATAAAAQDQPADTTSPTAAPVQTAPAPEQNTFSETTSRDAGADSSLRLGTGDLLELTVYNVPELSTKTRVSSSGDVYLPLIDYVHVAGLTIEEAQGLIEKRLADGGFLKSPHVTVFVNEYASQGASVLGEVSRPGVYPVLGQQRLFDLISAAGGLTEKAGRSVSVIPRGQPDKPIIVPLTRNLTDTPDSNIDVSPGDTVIVRKADVVYVVGDVGRPSGFLMDKEHLTVLQAVALAGGTTRTSKLSEARIIRKGPAGMTETPIQLNKILQAKAPDIPMLADDILFVPTNGAKIAAGRIAHAALQAATAVAVVAIVP